jgi:hypothetical protein
MFFVMIITCFLWQRLKTNIEEKGHLHNTPSGATIEEDGLDVGGMMVNQQEKIEEIYLHLIAMNKKILALEAENEGLKAEILELTKRE